MKLHLDSLAALPFPVTPGTNLVDDYPTAFTRNSVRRRMPTKRTLTDLNPPLGAQYRARLAGLGLSDPVGAVELFDRADHLTEAADEADTAPVPAVTSGGRLDLVAALAAGDLDPSAPATRRKVTDASAPPPPARPVSEDGELYRRAAHDALRNAAQLIVDHGDGWLHPLRNAARVALDNGDQAAWDHAQGLAALLRHLGALDIAEGAAGYETFVARPDLVHLWQLEHATDARITGWTWTDNGHTLRLYRRPVGAPWPTVDVLAEHRGDWRPDVYTGSQTAAHIRAVVETPPQHRAKSGAL